MFDGLLSRFKQQDSAPSVDLTTPLGRSKEALRLWDTRMKPERTTQNLLLYSNWSEGQKQYCLVGFLGDQPEFKEWFYRHCYAFAQRECFGESGIALGAPLYEEGRFLSPEESYRRARQRLVEHIQRLEAA